MAWTLRATGKWVPTVLPFVVHALLLVRSGFRYVSRVTGTPLSSPGQVPCAHAEGRRGGGKCETHWPTPSFLSPGPRSTSLWRAGKPRPGGSHHSLPRNTRGWRSYPFSRHPSSCGQEQQQQHIGMLDIQSSSLMGFAEGEAKTKLTGENSLLCFVFLPVLGRLGRIARRLRSFSALCRVSALPCLYLDVSEEHRGLLFSFLVPRPQTLTRVQSTG